VVNHPQLLSGRYAYERQIRGWCLLAGVADVKFCKAAGAKHYRRLLRPCGRSAQAEADGGERSGCARARSAFAQAGNGIIDVLV